MLAASTVILSSIYCYALGTVRGLSDCTHGQGGNMCLRAVEVWIYHHIFGRYAPPDLALGQPSTPAPSHHTPDWLRDAHTAVLWGGSLAVTLAFLLGLSTIFHCARVYKETVLEGRRSATRVESLGAPIGQSVCFAGVLVATVVVQQWVAAGAVAIILVPLLHGGFWVHVVGFYWTWIAGTALLLGAHASSQHGFQACLFPSRHPATPARPALWGVAYLALSVLYLLVGVFIAVWRLIWHLVIMLLAVSRLDAGYRTADGHVALRATVAMALAEEITA